MFENWNFEMFEILYVSFFYMIECHALRAWLRFQYHYSSWSEKWAHLWCLNSFIKWWKCWSSVWILSSSAKFIFDENHRWSSLVTKFIREVHWRRSSSAKFIGFHQTDGMKRPKRPATEVHLIHVTEVITWQESIVSSVLVFDRLKKKGEEEKKKEKLPI